MNQEKAIRFLYDLVSIYSPSLAERAVAERALCELKDLGFRSAHIDEAGNVVGQWGKPGALRKIALVGHIDTVKGELPVTITDTAHGEVLTGRGSVDAKGPFATFVYAVANLPLNIDTEFTVVGAVEEEVASSKGARYLARTMQSPDAVIIGEPSQTAGITLGYKGRLIVEATAQRSMTHSAHQHISVAELLIDYFTAVRNWVAGKNEHKTNAFETIDLTIQNFNTESDGLTERGKITLGFRLGIGFHPASVQEDLIKLNSSPSNINLHAMGREIPVRFDKKMPLANIFRAAIRHHGLEPRLFLKTGTSDMNVLAQSWNCPMLAYGPGDSSLDHTPEEHILVADYLKAIQILSDALTRIN
ncbi:[LysW]-lysine hydrolase [bacterium]|nr:[LysW]-lysine hydrolase [bacterium]